MVLRAGGSHFYNQFKQKIVLDWCFFFSMSYAGCRFWNGYYRGLTLQCQVVIVWWKVLIVSLMCMIVYVCIGACVCLYVHVCTCMRARTTCVCICEHVCVFIVMFLCLCVFICGYVLVWIVDLRVNQIERWWCVCMGVVLVQQWQSPRGFIYFQ